MKKIIAFIVFLSFTCSYGQTNPPATSKKLTFDEKVEVLYNRFTRGLTLSPEQKEKIKPLVAAIVSTREAAVQELKTKKTTGEPLSKEELVARKTKREADEAAFKAEMKKILTPQQYAEFELGLTRKRANGEPNQLEKEVEVKP